MNIGANFFSDTIEKVIKNASRIALRFGSDVVGTEHILYGITSVKDCLASKALAEYGVTEEDLFELFAGSEADLLLLLLDDDGGVALFCSDLGALGAFCHHFFGDGFRRHVFGFGIIDDIHLFVFIHQSFSFFASKANWISVKIKIMIANTMPSALACAHSPSSNTL